MYNKLKESKAVMVVIFYFGVALLISFLLWGIIGMDLTYSIMVGFISWTIIYFFLLFKHFWIIVDANYGVVLKDYFTEQKKNLTDTEITDKLFVPEGQRALFEGIHPKFPWETIIDQPIHLVKATDGGDTMVVVDCNKVRYNIKYEIPLTPVRDSIGLIRFLLVTEKIAKDYFQGVVEAAIRAKFLTVNGDDVQTKNFSKKVVANLFEGEGKITEEEKQYGRFTNTPIIADITKSDSGQKMDEIKTRGIRIREAHIAITGEQNPQLDPDSAALLTALAAEADVRIVNIKGMPEGVVLNLGEKAAKEGKKK